MILGSWLTCSGRASAAFASWARARLAESWTMDAADELLRAAVDITRAASGLAAQRFLEGVPVSTKPDGTDVTPADIEVEELIRSLIAARFPMTA